MVGMTDKIDSAKEPLGVAELNHTVTSSVESDKAEIGAEMSELPKVKHQKKKKKRERDFCLLDAKKKATDLQTEGGKTQREKTSSISPSPSQNIPQSKTQSITHSSHLSLFAEA